jgi:hypothetical protein
MVEAMGSKLSGIPTSTLRAWLSVAELLPEYLPLVLDIRLAVRSELWRRDVEAEEERAWPVGGPGGCAVTRQTDVNDILMLVSIFVLMALSLAPGGHVAHGCGVAP